MCLIQILKWFSLKNGMVVQQLQVRLHTTLDGSLLAHAIQVPMGPLLKSESWKRSNSKGFTSVQKFHTHTYIYTYICILNAQIEENIDSYSILSFLSSKSESVILFPRRYFPGIPWAQYQYWLISKCQVARVRAPANIENISQGVRAQTVAISWFRSLSMVYDR